MRTVYALIDTMYLKFSQTALWKCEYFHITTRTDGGTMQSDAADQAWILFSSGKHKSSHKKRKEQEEHNECITKN